MRKLIAVCAHWCSLWVWVRRIICRRLPMPPCERWRGEIGEPAANCGAEEPVAVGRNGAGAASAGAHGGVFCWGLPG